jgi:WD40 repeat protein
VVNEKDPRGFEWYFWKRRCYGDVLTLNSNAGVVDALFTPDGQHILTGDWSGRIRLWDLASGSELRTHSDQMGVVDIALAPDGEAFAASHWFELRIYNSLGSVRHTLLRDNQSRLNAVAYRPDGEHIASGSADGMVRIWHAESGREVLSFKAPDGDIKCLAFSPDSLHLAVAASRGAAVWDAASGTELKSLRRAGQLVQSIAYTPDGGRLATTYVDGTIIIWDAVSSKEIRAVKVFTIPPSVPMVVD